MDKIKGGYSNMNNVTIVGRLVRDVELKYTTNGTAMARGTVAVDRGLSKEKKEQAEAQGQPTADFISIVAWRGQAEFMANYTEKGGRVAIVGNITTSTWVDDQGQTRYGTDVTVRNVEPIDWKGQGGQQYNQGGQQYNQGGQAGNIEGFYPTSNDDIPF